MMKNVPELILSVSGIKTSTYHSAERMCKDHVPVSASADPDSDFYSCPVVP